MGKNDSWKHDSDYISYIDSGESAAVFIVRDLANAVDTRGKWIDIVSMSIYYLKDNTRAFNWIVAELFPRKIQPEYDKNDVEHNRYLTWRAAHEDISCQRAEGYIGPKFLVLCSIRNMNKGKFTVHTRVRTLKKYWEPQSAYREVKEIIRQPFPPEWIYIIRAVKEINSEQVEYIRNNENTLIEKIRKNKGASLEIFDFPLEKSRKGAKNNDRIATSKQTRRNHRSSNGLAK
ncbi:MAG: hypothetical protein IJ697_04290 [Synergistaceae bacterium]|nr:hypothetical protein [Synergistaceae bacterium]